MTDDIELRRRRVAYRATHRGTKEMDLILGRFAQARLSGMSEGELAIFERFAALPDPILAGWFSQIECPNEAEFVALIGVLRAFHGLSEPNKVVSEKTEQ